jgi:hypothetical protein
LTSPWCTYTDPEIAHVGLSENEARERGIAFRTFTQELAAVDRAVLDGEDEGFVKVLVGPRRPREALRFRQRASGRLARSSQKAAPLRARIAIYVALTGSPSAAYARLCSGVPK